MSVSLPAVARHPNRLPFRGVLTVLDVPSDKPPAGARGHRVLLTRVAAEAALPSLLGMGLDYTPRLDGHDARRKVGIITGADIIELPSVVGRRSSAATSTDGPRPKADDRRPMAIEVRGYVFAKDFPDVVRELRANGRALGMSYELADAQVADLRASVWTLTEATFTGAAVLRRDKAAYTRTWIEIEANAAQRRKAGAADYIPNGGNMEPMEAQLAANAERLAAAVAALEQALDRTVSRIEANQDALTTKVERIVAAIEESDSGSRKLLEERVAELERANHELKAQAGRLTEQAARKTLPPLVTSLLAKNGIEPEQKLDAATLDQTLASLSVEQRIAVKAQMARAGLIE